MNVLIPLNHSFGFIQHAFHRRALSAAVSDLAGGKITTVAAPYEPIPLVKSILKEVLENHDVQSRDFNEATMLLMRGGFERREAYEFSKEIERMMVDAITMHIPTLAPCDLNGITWDICDDDALWITLPD